jgi:ubiquinone/menaquinone biosynthesis C-methylase UbiE
MDTQAKINALWDGASAEYDDHSGHGMKSLAQIAAWRTALRSLLPRSASRVLDVGCGTGVMTMLVAGLGHRVVGIDLSEGMLVQARAKLRPGSTVRFRLGDALAPPGRRGSFDAVLNRHVLWTMTDPARALRNWRRMLRPGGRLVVIDGLWGKEPDERIDHISHALPLIEPGVTVEDIRDLVVAAGFANVAISSLDEVDRIERELQKRDESWQPYYVITARRPAKR